MWILPHWADRGGGSAQIKGMVYLFLFLFGAVLYVSMELFWRGRSHISMAIAGGTVLVLLFGIYTRYPLMPLLTRCIVGGVVITAVEYIVGAIVNVRMGLGVWDYSDLPHNLYGQICLRFSLLWAALSAPASAVVDFVYTSLMA